MSVAFDIRPEVLVVLRDYACKHCGGKFHEHETSRNYDDCCIGCEDVVAEADIASRVCDCCGAWVCVHVQARGI